MILQACIFESVSKQVEHVPIPDWAFTALGPPVEKRNFRYADMLYPDGRRRNQWRRNSSVPDVSQPETKLWFYFLAASFIDLGFEAVHFGQAELMNSNAGAGRLPGRPGGSRARADRGEPLAHHRPDGALKERRPGAVPRCRHG
jgi:hypothetical protein